MRDLGRVTNAVQLQVNFVRLCASQIPNHWSRLTPPEVGAAAFNYCDAAISSAIAIILHTADSPTDRATLALTRCCLSSRGGGLGTADYSRRSPSNYTSAFISAWPASCSACPALSSIAISPTSTSPAIVSFCTAYEHVSSTLASVRDRHSALDANTRTWVDGSCHSAYRLPVPRSLELPNPADLFGDAPSTPASRLSQRSLAAVVNSDAWMVTMADCAGFDNANPGTVLRREAALFVSCSQEGAGAWLARLPDASLFRSVTPSTTFLLLCQRRLGLHLTALRPPLDEAARRGEMVTEHMRLGDHFINAANATRRHNDGLRASFTALSALSTATQAPGSFVLGDRGDGTRTSKEEARKRYAHINKDHIPDAIRHSIPPCCYEYKCYTPMVVGGALGNGSPGHGGAPSTTDGGDFAFGNTEEALRTKVFGLSERGDKAQGALDRRTGRGWVGEKPGDYADALAKGHGVILLGCESTGALFTAFTLLLKALGRAANAPGTHDSTVYGSGRASPQGFYAHHVAAISSAVVNADALTVVNAASSMGFKLSVGMPALS